MRTGVNFIEKINLKEKLSKFSDHWSPKVIAEMKDDQFKLVKIKAKLTVNSSRILYLLNLPISPKRVFLQI
jgi:hypothetical protein